MDYDGDFPEPDYERIEIGDNIKEAINKYKILKHVTKVTKLSSKKLDNLILAIKNETGMDLIGSKQTADQIILFNTEAKVHLEERIYVRMMCNGQVIYTFEFLDECWRY